MANDIIGISESARGQIVVTRENSITVYENAKKVRIWQCLKISKIAAVLNSSSHWLLAATESHIKFEKNGKERHVEREVSLALGWRVEEAVVVSKNGIGIYFLDEHLIHHLHELRFSTPHAAWIIHKKYATIDGAISYDELNYSDSFPQIALLDTSYKIAKIHLPETSQLRRSRRGSAAKVIVQTITPDYKQVLNFFKQDISFLSFESTAIHILSIQNATTKWLRYDQSSGSIFQSVLFKNEIVSCISVCGNTLAIGLKSGSVRFFELRTANILPIFLDDDTDQQQQHKITTSNKRKNTDQASFIIAPDSLEFLPKRDSRNKKQKKQISEQILATRLATVQSPEQVSPIILEALKANNIKDLSPLASCPRIALLAALDLLDETYETHSLELSFDIFVNKIFNDSKAINTLRLSRANLISHTIDIQCLALSLAPALADIRAIAATATKHHYRHHHYHLGDSASDKNRKPKQKKRKEKKNKSQNSSTTRKEKKRKTNPAPTINIMDTPATSILPPAATDGTGVTGRHHTNSGAHKHSRHRRRRHRASFSLDHQNDTPLLVTERFQLY